MKFHHFGDVSGAPLVFFHGTPSSGDEGELLHQAAINHKVHVLAPDRPGFGKTAFQSNSILDRATQCADQLQQMGIDNYAVAGCSGGGPYTFALASVAPEAVTFAAPIASMFPFAGWNDLAGMHLNNKLVFILAKKKPDWIRFLFNITVKRIRQDVRKAYFNSLKLLPEIDANYFAQKNVADIMIRAMQNSMQQGNEGAIWETQLFSRDWGVDFSAIRCPLTIWHGTQDTAVPVTMAHRFAETHPAFRLEILPHGHISTFAAVLELSEFWRQIKCGSSR